MRSSNQCDAVQFFNDFVEAFGTFDGLVVAQRYHQPFIAVHADGNVEVMQSHSHTAEYFQKFLVGYYADGCRSCTYKDLAVVEINEFSILATVTWELYDSNTTLVSSWRESYSIVSTSSKMLVLTSIDHST